MDHQEFRPFSCHTCDKRYLRKNNLEDHVLMEHPDSEQVMKLTGYLICMHQEMKFAVVDSNHSYILYVYFLDYHGEEPKVHDTCHEVPEHVVFTCPLSVLILTADWITRHQAVPALPGAPASQYTCDTLRATGPAQLQCSDHQQMVRLHTTQSNRYSQRGQD